MILGHQTCFQLYCRSFWAPPLSNDVYSASGVYKDDYNVHENLKKKKQGLLPVSKRVCDVIRLKHSLPHQRAVSNRFSNRKKEGCVPVSSKMFKISVGGTRNSWHPLTLCCSCARRLKTRAGSY